MLPFHSSRHSTLQWIGTNLILAAGLLAATLARADYLWLQPDGAGVRAHAGELRKPLEKLPALLEAKAVLPEGKEASPAQAACHFSVPRAVGDTRFTVTLAGANGVLTPAKDGAVSFTPYIPGLYVLEVTARVNNGSVTLEGKKYEGALHTATLSFKVPQ